MSAPVRGSGPAGGLTDGVEAGAGGAGELGRPTEATQRASVEPGAQLEDWPSIVTWLRMSPSAPMLAVGNGAAASVVTEIATLCPSTRSPTGQVTVRPSAVHAGDEDWKLSPSGSRSVATTAGAMAAPVLVTVITNGTGEPSTMLVAGLLLSTETVDWTGVATLAMHCSPACGWITSADGDTSAAGVASLAPTLALALAGATWPVSIGIGQLVSGADTPDRLAIAPSASTEAGGI